MHELPKAPLALGVSLSSVTPESVASSILVSLLSLTGKLRAVVDVGGAPLPSTSQSRAVVDVSVMLLPAAIELQAVGDTSSLSLSSMDSLMCGNVGNAALLLT